MHHTNVQHYFLLKKLVPPNKSDWEEPKAQITLYNYITITNHISSLS